VEIIMTMMIIIIIIKPMDNEEKGDLMILTVRTYQHSTNSTILQIAVNIKENYTEEADK